MPCPHREACTRCASNDDLLDSDAGAVRKQTPPTAGTQQIAPQLATKRVAPRAPVAWVDRPRVAELLDRGVERPLTLVSAPAGWGKTAGLAQWIAGGTAPGPVAWLPLDQDDADPHRFWGDAVASLGAASPALATLGPPPPTGLKPFLITLLNAVAELDEPLVLAVDDLHFVTSPGAIGDLEWFLQNVPPNLRLVVSTRSDPLFRLQRLRVSGEMTEVRAADLAFTFDEASALLNALDLATPDVKLLLQRTEGWVTGLRFAQLSLEGHRDPHGFIAGFAGEDRAVSDYLISEVVDGQPPETLGFLLRTSIVERLTGSLADALTGTADGSHMLRELARRDTFVSATDDGNGWYRYHRLFADVLRAELHRRLPGEVRKLHGIAARWHARHGSPLDALRHGVAAADWELSAEVLGKHWLVFVMRGGAAALSELVEQIPAEAVRSDAELALATAGLLLEQGDHEGADELLVRAYELAPRLTEPRDRRFAVTSTATALYRARLRGDVEEALSAARIVLDEHWDRAVAVDVRALTLANLGIAEFWAGRLAEGADHLQQAAGLAVECGNDFVLFLAESYGAAAHVREGRLREGWSRAHTAIQLAERRGWTQVAHAAMAYCTLATVHLWRGELIEAERFADRAAETLEHTREPLLGPAVALARARLLILKGEALAALDLVRAASATEPLPPFLRVSTGLLEAEVWLGLGEPARARRRIEEIGTEDAPDAAVGLARLELATGEPGAAIRAVATFLADEREPILPFARAEAWAIDAIARDAVHDEDGALRALERALDLTEPRGYAGILARYGAPLRSLLRRRVAKGTAHRALAGQLLSTLDEPPTGERTTATVLLEPLSERELAVLRFLPTMMSNAEIASEMFVSVNTVKTHLKHIYRKLDVAGRRDCVKRARELRLLSPGLGDR
jgi:LuxR family transcriptional regulator, maltose regulon positive regulatory protein